jgi:hypothetical protein
MHVYRVEIAFIPAWSGSTRSPNEPHAHLGELCEELDLMLSG